MLLVGFSNVLSYSIKFYVRFHLNKIFLHRKKWDKDIGLCLCYLLAQITNCCSNDGVLTQASCFSLKQKKKAFCLNMNLDLTIFLNPNWYFRLTIKWCDVIDMNDVILI